PVILHAVERCIETLDGIMDRRVHPRTARIQFQKTLLLLGQQGIETLMHVPNLHLSLKPPYVHDTHDLKSDGLIVHVKKLCHGLPSLALLLLPPLCRLIPLALCFPLRPPGRLASARVASTLRPAITIRVACAPNHAVTQLALGNVSG